MTTTKNYRVHQEPRISSAKLGEYRDASPRRRETILRDQKYAPAFMTMRYTAAEDVIRAALMVHPQGVTARLQAGAQRVAQLPITTAFTATAQSCCLQAIRQFERQHASLGLDGVTCGLASRTGYAANVEQVKVSVRPVVLLSQRVRGSLKRGAMLTVLCKGRALDDEGGKVAATVLARILTETGTIPTAELLPRLCIVHDVFSGRTFSAPSRMSVPMKDVESMCRTIYAQWPHLVAPNKAA